MLCLIRCLSQSTFSASVLLRKRCGNFTQNSDQTYLGLKMNPNRNKSGSDTSMESDDGNQHCFICHIVNAPIPGFETSTDESNDIILGTDEITSIPETDDSNDNEDCNDDNGSQNDAFIDTGSNSQVDFGDDGNEANGNLVDAQIFVLETSTDDADDVILPTGGRNSIPETDDSNDDEDSTGDDGSQDDSSEADTDSYAQIDFDDDGYEADGEPLEMQDAPDDPDTDASGYAADCEPIDRSDDPPTPMVTISYDLLREFGYSHERALELQNRGYVRSTDSSGPPSDYDEWCYKYNKL